MDLLIDTHTLLWYYEGSSELPIKIRELINDIANNCYISIGSLWEITIKYRLGKLELENGLMDLFDFIQRNNIIILNIEMEHLLSLNKLEGHHKDPFDRIIIAQAITENLYIASKDAVFDDYKIKIIW